MVAAPAEHIDDPTILIHARLDCVVWSSPHPTSAPMDESDDSPSRA